MKKQKASRWHQPHMTHATAQRFSSTPVRFLDGLTGLSPLGMADIDIARSFRQKLNVDLTPLMPSSGAREAGRSSSGRLAIWRSLF